MAQLRQPTTTTITTMSGHDHDHPRGLRALFSRHSHDSADSIDDALEASAEGIRALKISLSVLMVTAVIQLAIVLLTDSVALLADTIHNFSDALTAVPLWIAFALARRAPTRRYTYGYGRFEDIAGLFIVSMIGLSAAVAGYESFRRLLDPRPLEHAWIVLAAGVVGFAGNELVAVFRIRTGRRIGSAALVADGLHARTDGFTSIAVAIGALGALAGFDLADPLVCIAITVAILLVLKNAGRDVYHRLMDAVDPQLVEAAELRVAAVAQVRSVEELQMRWIGHRLHAQVAVAISPTLDMASAQQVVAAVEHQLRIAVPRLSQASVRAVLPRDLRTAGAHS